MKAPLLVVTDQWPHPPRNGVTLPVCNYIEQLRGTHAVSLCVLRPEGADDGCARADNEARFGPVTQLALRRRSRSRRIADELTLSGMYQHGWDVADDSALEHHAPMAQLVSPISAVAAWRQLRTRRAAWARQPLVCGVNDCTAAEYRWRVRSPAATSLARLKAWSHVARAPLVARIEAALLADAKRVLLQTDADLAAMRALVGERTAQRCVLAPNGVREDLFQLRPRLGTDVVFVAELSGEYATLTRWLCEQVWPRVQAGCPQATLTIVGKGADAALRQAMAGAGARHLDFAPDLAAIYAEAGLAWSPVFKGYGLINKTLEAMASGLPVVGGRAAYNGIQGFAHGVHGIGLDKPDEHALVQATVQLLQSAEQRQRMGDAGRALVRGRFSWARTADTIRAAFALEGR